MVLTVVIIIIIPRRFNRLFVDVRLGIATVRLLQHVIPEHRGRVETQRPVRSRRWTGLCGGSHEKRAVRRRQRRVPDFRGAGVPADRRTEIVQEFGLPDVRGQVPIQIRVDQERRRGARTSKLSFGPLPTHHQLRRGRRFLIINPPRNWLSRVTETQTDNRTPRGHVDRRVLGRCRGARYDPNIGVPRRLGIVDAAERGAEHPPPMDRRQFRRQRQLERRATLQILVDRQQGTWTSKITRITFRKTDEKKQINFAA